ncbi:MAG: endonuclease/exonuclease/phosphatase family protein, partial [Odoribacter sp.]|nr:endonuclease/exonuclease/phosphatase family protein [Odoribacter sp.]
MKIVLGLFMLVFLAFSVQAQRTVRFMSYNIRHAAGMDNRLDAGRIAEVIRREAPDVVALQEVDSATVRTGKADILHEIADESLMYRIFAPAIPYQGGKYGIGMLCKEKPLHFKYMPLPGREEPRVLLVAEFEDYVFCCTHFSLTEEDQLTAVTVLAGELDTIRKPVFLAGDLNALPDSPVLKALREKFVVLTNPKEKTFPADKPQECLDY